MSPPQGREGALVLDNIRISKHLSKSKKYLKQAQKLGNCCKHFEVFIDWEKSIRIQQN